MDPKVSLIIKNENLMRVTDVRFQFAPLAAD